MIILMNKIKNVINSVNIAELSREVDTLLGRKSDEEQNERMLDITKKLLANSDKKLLEEIRKVKGA